MNNCSNCGYSPLDFRSPAGDKHKRFVCNNCQMIHYQNPKIICGALVFYKEKVLLCKRSIEPRKGKWNLPAGFMENNETLKQGAAREALEEANADIEIERLHTIYDVVHVNQVYFLFLARLKEPVFSAGEETLEAQLFDLDEIPWDELAFQSNIFALQQYMANSSFPGVYHGDSLGLDF